MDLEQQLSMAHRENLAMQEMLAHVLSAYGKPVHISKESLQSGKFEGKRINIEDDIARDEFVISLVDDV